MGWPKGWRRGFKRGAMYNLLALFIVSLAGDFRPSAFHIGEQNYMAQDAIANAGYQEVVARIGLGTGKHSRFPGAKR